jgi:hypothetical protein
MILEAKFQDYDTNIFSAYGEVLLAVFYDSGGHHMARQNKHWSLGLSSSSCNVILGGPP